MKRMRKGIIWALCIVMIFSLAGCGLLGSGTKKTERPITDYSNDADSLKELFEDTMSKKYEDLSVEYNSLGWYTVSYKYNGMTINSSDLIRSNMTYYINFCRKAYQIDGVDSVHFDVSFDMKDAKGNISADEVFSLRMPKSTFETYKWENLEYVSVYNQFSKDCEFWWIAPSILRFVEAEDVFYCGTDY